MSGTSLDGIDAVLADLNSSPPSLLYTFYLPYERDLRSRLLDLHHSSHNELHRAAMMGNELAHRYAEAVVGLLNESGIKRQDVAAIGCHGQTCATVRNESGAIQSSCATPHCWLSSPVLP